MMSGDCQSQGLAEWLQLLGWHERLEHSDLRKLNTPKMRSVWRHLKAQVMPTHIASTVRKNVLLSRLEKENLYVGQFRNFKLDSVKQLDKVKEILKIEEEKDKIKEKIRAIDEKLKNEKLKFLHQNTAIEWEMNKLNEVETKTAILGLKLSKLSKDWKKIDLDKSTAETLKVSKTSTCYNEINHQKYTVCNYVKDYGYPDEDIDDEDTDDDSEYMCHMMSKILEFRPYNILSGILLNAKEALKSLHIKVDIVANPGEEASTKMITFKKKLRDLNVLVIKNHQKIHESQEKKILDSNQLQKEKFELLKVFTEMYIDYKEGTEAEFVKENTQHRESIGEEIEDNINNKQASEILNDLVGKIHKERKENKIREEKNLLMPDEDFKLLKDLKQSVISLTEEVNGMWRSVEKKINKFNKVTSAIFSSVLDSGELSELFAETTQLASDFKTETAVAFKSTVASSEFTDMLLKEIEMFRRIPMIALQRKWDTSNEMLQVCSSERFYSNPSLLIFLNQTEEKNMIINVLEKYLWSLYISPQFH